VLPPGDIYIITKCRDSIATRYPKTAAPGRHHPLEQVRTLGPKAPRSMDRVTGATTTPMVAVAIRTYRSLYLYSAAALAEGADFTADLRSCTNCRAKESRYPTITVWLSSSEDEAPRLSRLTRPDTRVTIRIRECQSPLGLQLAPGGILGFYCQLRESAAKHLFCL
jgi:hypothetical protein